VAKAVSFAQHSIRQRSTELTPKAEADGKGYFGYTIGYSLNLTFGMADILKMTAAPLFKSRRYIIRLKILFLGKVDSEWQTKD